MKIFLLALSLIPILSFAQLSKKEKKSIEQYASHICDCVQDLSEDFEPEVLDALLYMAENGEEAGLQRIKESFDEMSAAEIDDFLASFAVLEDPVFLRELGNCIPGDILEPELFNRVSKEGSDAHDYYQNFVESEKSCVMLKVFEF